MWFLLVSAYDVVLKFSWGLSTFMGVVDAAPAFTGVVPAADTGIVPVGGTTAFLATDPYFPFFLDLASRAFFFFSAFAAFRRLCNLH